MRAILKPIYENSCNIVLSSDENFAPFCAVAIQSVIDTSDSSKFYDIIIISDNIKPHTKELIQKLSDNKNNISIRFLYIDFDFSKYKIKSKFAIQAYYRLLLPELLPDYSRIIYLDCDTIVKSDISELFNIDIFDNCIAGVKDAYIIGLFRSNSGKLSKYYEAAVLNNDNINNYINSGVLVMNLKKIKSLYTVHDFFKFSENRNLYWPDQTMISLMFYDKIYHLPAEWNVIPVIAENSKKNKIASCAPQNIYNDYIESLKKYKIIHFASTTRPWTKPDSLLSHEFWQVSRKTVFYESIIYKMIKTNTDDSIYDLYKKNIFFRLFRFTKKILKIK